MVERGYDRKRAARAPTRLSRGVILAFTLLCFVSAPSAAQELDKNDATSAKRPNRDNGEAVAKTLCASCHLLGDAAADAVVLSDVPSFPSIANRPGQSATALAIWLMKPHAPMPDLQLTQKEIRDLSEYILSLRAN